MNPFNVLFVLIYDFLLVAGATYLVVEKDWSMWTYLLALCFMFHIEKDKNEKPESKSQV